MAAPNAPSSTPSLSLRLCGNATLLLESAGCRVVTDPWLSLAIGPWPRLRPCALTPEELALADVVLISHAHPDHLDPSALRHVRSETVILCPGGVPERKLRSLGVGHVETLSPWQEWRRESARIWTVPSVHTRDCLAYVVELSGRRVYFAGDSGPGTPFAEIRERCGPLDVAVLPVGGSTLAPGPFQRHLTPELAARAARELQPRMALPMHWGHMACVPAALDRFRGTAAQWADAMRWLAPEIPFQCPEDGETVLL